MNAGFKLDPAEGKLMGVCAGLARWSGIDPLPVRLAMVAAVLIAGPIALLFYILTGWLAEERQA